MKLEVGKSYRSIKGKIVTIVFAEAVGIRSGSPFQGDDDHWYTTEGRRHYVGAWRSHENDLIAEVIIKRRSWQVGDRVAMYGCGNGSSTFWMGDRGTITCINAYGRPDEIIVQPDKWEDEAHCMHIKQCRRLIKRQKS